MHVQSLGWQDPLEEGMVTHSNILALGIPWTEEPGGLQSKKSQRVGHNWSDFACMLACFTSFAKVIYVYCDILGIMEIKNNDGEEIALWSWSSEIRAINSLVYWIPWQSTGLWPITAEGPGFNPWLGN